jgi:lysophospholipase L1-like esterase
MKRVILIGDSIRMGYQDTVRQALADVAEVWGPEENGGHTANLLTHLHHWVLHREADVLHINAGLHDLKTIVYGEQESVIPLAHYRDNVETLLRTVRTHTNMRIIWAATTPINEANANAAHAKGREFSRHEAKVTAYNMAAAEVAMELDVPVNDLYGLVMAGGRDTLLRNDGVHFTDDGCRVLGEAVARAIRSQL